MSRTRLKLLNRKYPYGRREIVGRVIKEILSEIILNEIFNMFEKVFNLNNYNLLFQKYVKNNLLTIKTQLFEVFYHIKKKSLIKL